MLWETVATINDLTHSNGAALWIRHLYELFLVRYRKKLVVGAKESTSALSSNMLASISKLILESLINVNKCKICFILMDYQLANGPFIKVHFRVQCFAEGDLLFTLKVSGFGPITLTSKSVLQPDHIPSPSFTLNITRCYGTWMCFKPSLLRL